MEKITQHKVIDALYRHFLSMLFDDFGKQKGSATDITYHDKHEAGKKRKEWIEIVLENGQVVKYFVEID